MTNIRFSLLSIVFVFLSFSQSQAQDKMFYTGIVNYIPHDRSIPAIGLINLIAGDHTGAQIGLLNHSAGSVIGYQAALINQGTVNVRGAQTALINNVSNKVSGAQVALINNAEEIEGAQVGLINKTKVVDGVQIGLINYADSIKSGVPIGLLFLGKGAMFSIEAAMTEMHPFQVSVRTGVDRLYFILGAAYSDNLDGYALWGAGAGTKLPISNKMSINPEIQYFGSFSDKRDFDYTSVSLNFGFDLSQRVALFVGPSFGLNIARPGESTSENKPFANLANGSSSSKLEQVVGLRAAVRFDLSRVIKNDGK